jgi:hypothetical protein
MVAFTSRFETIAGRGAGLAPIWDNGKANVGFSAGHELRDHAAGLTANLELKIRQRFLPMLLRALLFIKKDRQGSK